MSLYQAEKDGDVETLAGYLERGETETVRERAATLLAGFEEEVATEALIEAVESDDSAAVRAEAIDSLDAIGVDAILECMSRIAEFEREGGADWVAADEVATVLESSAPEMRMAAASALGHLDEPRAVPVLVEALSDSDPRVRARVARACGTLGHARAVGPLATCLGDETAAVRREAAQSLGRIGTDGALSALFDRVDDPSETVRYVVVSALGESGRPEPVPALGEALSDPSPMVRRAAVLSIVELLSEAGSQQSHAIRERVEETLTETADVSVLDPLIEILESGEGSVQKRNAAWLLGQLAGEAHHRQAVDGLIALLDDDDGMSAQVAVTSLVSIGGTPVEQRLITFALDEENDENARAKAVFALGQVGGERTRERLDRLIDTTDADAVRRQAFSAVSKLDGGEAR
ncbi:MAG: HEAT repeat domain-containing protein [Halalkalicoccus sp.]